MKKSPNSLFKDPGEEHKCNLFVLRKPSSVMVAIRVKNTDTRRTSNMAKDSNNFFRTLFTWRPKKLAAVRGKLRAGIRTPKRSRVPAIAM